MKKNGEYFELLTDRCQHLEYFQEIRYSDEALFFPMNAPKKDHIEEISVDDIEVLDNASAEKVTRISADEPVHPGMGENPFGKMMEMVDEWKKMRFFGPLALVLSLFAVSMQTKYLAPAAILLALLDFWKGSKFTRKLSIFAIIVAVLSLLNTWT